MTDYDNLKVYNSRLLNNYVRLFRDKYPHVDIFDILSYANIEHEQIDNYNEWFSQAQVNRFHERIGRYFDDPKSIAREAGRYIYSDKNLGIFQKFSVDVLGLGYVYKHACSHADELTKTCKFDSKQLSDNKYEIKAEFYPWVKESPLQEPNRLGMIEAAPLLFSDKLAFVDSVISGNTVKYIVSWNKPKSYYLHFFRKLSLFIAVTIVGGILIISGMELAKIPALISLFILFALDHFYWYFKYHEQEQVKEIQENNINKIINKIIKNYTEDYYLFDRLDRIAPIVIGTKDLDTAIKEISKILIKLKYRKIAFFISDLDGDTILLNHRINYADKLAQIRVEIEKINQVKRLSVYHYFEDATALKSRFQLDIHSYFDQDDYPLIYMPIIYDKSIIGFFWVTPENIESALKGRRYKFLHMVASHIALGIHRAMAYNELVESDRMKSDFISTASHELNTPIQILFMAYSDMEATNDIHSNLPIIKGELIKLKQIVKSFLEIQKTSNEPLNLSRISISHFFEKMKSAINNTEKMFNHTLFYDYQSSEKKICCDIDKIITVILNLFNNACKYTPENGKILVRYTENNAAHTFSVIDNGIGIPKNIQKKVFIRFFQFEQSHIESVGGFGLGLSIAKHIVKLHSGDITIDSPLTANFPAPVGFIDQTSQQQRPGTCVSIHLPKRD